MRTGIVAGALGGVLFSGLLVWTSSEAAFTTTTSNPANSWSAGTVNLTDDSSSALFTAASLVPGDTDQKCILVTYSGSLAAGVKVYVSSLTGTLGPYLTMTIEQGTGATSSSCTGFVPETSTTQKVSTLGTDWATGFGTWAPTGVGTPTKAYRFTYAIDADNAAANRTAGITFTWQAQTT
jgi:hypothetical protein